MGVPETENSLYALLVEISRDVGEIKGDVKNVQNAVNEVSADSVSHDKELSERLDSYFTTMEKRQADIKTELESKLRNHEERILSLETKNEKMLAKWWNRIVEKIIWFFVIGGICVLMRWLHVPAEIENQLP